MPRTEEPALRRQPRVWRGGVLIRAGGGELFAVGTVAEGRVSIDCLTADCLRPWLGELTEAEQARAEEQLLRSALADAARLDELRPRWRSA
jgi:hypothetical protein